MIIRKINDEEMEDALSLVWEVFLEFEAVDYTEEGINEFKKTIDDKDWVNERDFYGAFDDNDKLLGVIATKDLNHIALFFVDGKYHRRGIGKQLYEKVKSLNDSDYFTVNSSPYAHDIYKHLGFVDTTDTEQCFHGLRFYPMKIYIKKDKINSNDEYTIKKH